MSNHRKKSQPEPPKSKTPPLALWLLGILCLTFIAYSPLFSPEKTFTNWDDDLYVVEQPLIQREGLRLKEIFDPYSAVAFNYHPLTMLSLALDYRAGWDPIEQKLSIAPFARTNLLLHLLNPILVYWLFFLLSGKQKAVGLMTALLFALHPLHVESVAWISGRKDLLYAFFFLASCLAYLDYRRKGRGISYALSFLFFLASALSKAMALPLPLILFLFDYLEKRKWTPGMLWEKLPFFLAAIFLGLHALQLQQGAMNSPQTYGMAERILFASYGYITYLIKIFWPAPLSAYYPYPLTIPWYFYLLPLACLGIILLPLRWKSLPISPRQWIGGWGFYTIMILLVLPFFSLGSSLMADRYTYLAHLGPFFLIALFIQQGPVKAGQRKWIRGVCFGFLILFLYRTYDQVKVWQDSHSLWTNVIQQYPIETHRHQVRTPYLNLADAFASQQEFDLALYYYQLLAEVEVADAGLYINLGNLHALKNEPKKALLAYNSALDVDSSLPEIYLRRGIVHTTLDQLSLALADLSRAIELDPGNETPYRLKARFMLDAKEYQANINFCREALRSFPSDPDLWFYLAVSHMSLGDYGAGVQNLEKAIELKPAPLYIYNLASAHYHLGNQAEALRLALKAREGGFPVSEEFIKKLSP